MNFDSSSSCLVVRPLCYSRITGTEKRKNDSVRCNICNANWEKAHTNLPAVHYWEWYVISPFDSARCLLSSCPIVVLNHCVKHRYAEFISLYPRYSMKCFSSLRWNALENVCAGKCFLSFRFSFLLTFPRQIWTYVFFMKYSTLRVRGL